MNETEPSKPSWGVYKTRQELMSAIERFRHPPEDAKKKCRLGSFEFTSINTQWRSDALSELFGPYGIGWRTESEPHFFVDHPDGSQSAFVRLRLLAFPVIAGTVVELVSGWHTGGTPNTKGAHELLKMSETDALSKACAWLGIGAAVYRGDDDANKYERSQPSQQSRPQRRPAAAPKAAIDWVDIPVKAGPYAGRLFADLVTEDPAFCHKVVKTLERQRERDKRWVKADDGVLYAGLVSALNKQQPRPSE